MLRYILLLRQAEQDVLKNRIQELTEFKLNLEVQVKAVLLQFYLRALNKDDRRFCDTIRI